jgi:hypothetical protein
MGAITTALRPALFEGLAVLVDLNFERSLRRRGDDRLNRVFEEGSEPPVAIGACSSFFMRRPLP